MEKAKSKEEQLVATSSAQEIRRFQAESVQNKQRRILAKATNSWSRVGQLVVTSWPKVMKIPGSFVQ